MPSLCCLLESPLPLLSPLDSFLYLLPPVLSLSLSFSPHTMFSVRACGTVGVVNKLWSHTGIYCISNRSQLLVIDAADYLKCILSFSYFKPTPKILYIRSHALVKIEQSLIIKPLVVLQVVHSTRLNQICEIEVGGWLISIIVAKFFIYLDGILVYCLYNKFNDKTFYAKYREVYCRLCPSMRGEGVLRRKCLWRALCPTKCLLSVVWVNCSGIIPWRSVVSGGYGKGLIS